MASSAMPTATIMNKPPSRSAGNGLTAHELHAFKLSQGVERKLAAWAALAALASGTAPGTVERLYGLTAADLAPYETEWTRLQQRRAPK